MKSFQSFILICFVTFLSLRSISQVLNENFNSGFPVSWSQSPAATWNFNSNLGVSGSGCVVAADTTFSLPTVTLYTPTLNLSGVVNPTITFKVALVKSNFMIPNIALSYSTSSGIQFMARWGSGFSSNTTYTLNGTEDFTPPLEVQNVNWQNCTHTFVIPATTTSGTFIFDAELINGGYVLLEDIVITGATSTLTANLAELNSGELVSVFPNPASAKKINIEGGDLRNIILFDELGRSLPIDYIKTGNIVEVNLATLPAGIYYVTAITKKQALIRKKIIVE